MKISDITNIDPFRSKNKEEIDRAVQEGRKYLRQRRKRQRQRGINAPIWGNKLNQLRKKPKTIEESRHQLREVQKLLNAQTTTVKGFNKWLHNITKTIKGKKRMSAKKDFKDLEYLKDFWSMYNMIQDVMPGIGDYMGSPDTFEIVHKYVDIGLSKMDTLKEIVEALRVHYNDLYEQDIEEDEWNYKFVNNKSYRSITGEDIF